MWLFGSNKRLNYVSHKFRILFDIYLVSQMLKVCQIELHGSFSEVSLFTLGLA